MAVLIFMMHSCLGWAKLALAFLESRRSFSIVSSSTGTVLWVMRPLCSLLLDLIDSGGSSSRADIVSFPSPTHTVVTTTWVRNTFKKPYSRSILISPTMSRSTSMLTTTCQISESILLGFPRQGCLLILGDAFV